MKKLIRSLTVRSAVLGAIIVVGKAWCDYYSLFPQEIYELLLEVAGAGLVTAFRRAINRSTE